MIRVIAVDDELPALRRAGKLLETLEGVQVAGLFDSPKLFLEHMLTTAEPVDLVLLDIEMPGLNGLELAERLRNIRPEVHVSFLTAYEEYARDAFGVEAIDYVLKPFTADDLLRTIGRLEKRRVRQSGKDPEAARSGLAVRSFGPFSVTTESGEQMRFRNSKSRELLAFLHHHRDKAVGKSQILDRLWEGRDADRAQVNLHSTVYQLRKDLEACGLHGAVEQMKTAGGSYRLHWPLAIEDDVAEYELAVREYGRSGSLAQLVRAIQLYGDGYLAGSGYDWAAPRQAELELGYARLLEAMADAYAVQSRHELALSPMQKLVHLHPLDERLHAKLAALLILAGRADDAREYCAMMAELLDEAAAKELDYRLVAANPGRYFGSAMR
ncbi:response regulator [Paenibacillus soyae]|uniref:Response regulator n=1 Tax=Paenibacillus soyae TaxID=2969249 RepID=A0A9X2MQY7_9BACL|nr:response regulator [Paenibacillus soyae]MCR2806638.1 response regulator [Paenibacillus soyae]